MDNQVIFESIRLSRVVFAIFLFIISLVGAHAVFIFKQSLQKKFPDFRLTIEQGATVIRFMILLLGGAIALFAVFGFSKEVIIGVGGSMAVAIGFGLKDIAAAILSGFLILFERPFQVGDRIQFGDTYGDVVGIGLRSTQVCTLDDSIVTIPNNQFITQSVSSANAGALDMLAQVDFYIHSTGDLTLVKRLVKESVLASRFVYLQKNISILFSDQFIEHHYCTRVRVKAYIVDTKYEKPFESDLTERLHRAFKDYNVLPPSKQLSER